MPREGPDAGAAFDLIAALEARLGRVTASDMSSHRGLQAPAAALNLPQLDTLVRQYMVVEDIVEVRIGSLLHMLVSMLAANKCHQADSLHISRAIAGEIFGHDAVLAVNYETFVWIQGDGEDDVSRKARRQCEAVREAVRQADVAGGLLATDAVDATVLQVLGRMALKPWFI